MLRGVAVGNDRDDTVRLVPRTFAGLRRYVGRHESGAAKTNFFKEFDSKSPQEYPDHGIRIPIAE